MSHSSQKNEHRQHSWRTIGAITIAIIAVQAAIDLIMGHEAEYFNAYATLAKLTQWVHGQSPTAQMIYKEEELGSLALPLATFILIGFPLLLAVVIVRVGLFLRRTIYRRA